MKGGIKMFKSVLGNNFDFDRNGKMDDFEKRAEYAAILNEVRLMEGINKPLSEMSLSELNNLAAKSGVDPSKSGF